MSLQDQFDIEDFVRTARAAESRASGLPDGFGHRVTVVPGDRPDARIDEDSLRITTAAADALRAAYTDPTSLNAGDGWERARRAALSVRRELRGLAAPRTDNSCVYGDRVLEQGVKDFGATLEAHRFVDRLELPRLSEDRINAAGGQLSAAGAAVRELTDPSTLRDMGDQREFVDSLLRVPTGERAEAIATEAMRGARVQERGRLTDALAPQDADRIRTELAADLSRGMDAIADVSADPVEGVRQGAGIGAETGERLRRGVVTYAQHTEDLAHTDDRLGRAAMRFGVAEETVANAIGAGRVDDGLMDHYRRELSDFTAARQSLLGHRIQIAEIVGNGAETRAIEAQGHYRDRVEQVGRVEDVGVRLREGQAYGDAAAQAARRAVSVADSRDDALRFYGAMTDPGLTPDPAGVGAEHLPPAGDIGRFGSERQELARRMLDPDAKVSFDRMPERLIASAPYLRPGQAAAPDSPISRALGGLPAPQASQPTSTPEVSGGRRPDGGSLRDRINDPGRE